MKHLLTITFVFLTIYLSAQVSLPNYSIGTSVTSMFESKRTIWLNQKYFKKLKKEDTYQGFLLDVGYIVGEGKLGESTLNEDKISFKIRLGSNFYKKRRDHFWITHGGLLGLQSIHFSKVGGFTEIGMPSYLQNTTMLREASMTQYSIQYVQGFEWFVDTFVSIEGVIYLGGKYVETRLHRGVSEERVSLILRKSDDVYRNQSYSSVDIDLALKLNFFLF